MYIVQYSRIASRWSPPQIAPELPSKLPNGAVKASLSATQRSLNETYSIAKHGFPQFIVAFSDSSLVEG